MSEPRHILVVGEITEELVEQFTEQFLAMDAKKREGGLRVRITSHGGCGEAGIALYDIIRAARNRITTEVWGMAESSAALVFQAGDARLMTPHSRLLLHDVQSESASTTGSRGIQAHADDIKALEETYFGIIGVRSGVGAAAVQAWCRDITSFYAERAVKCGLADGVLSPRGR